MEDLSDKDMLEISEFVSSKDIVRNAEMTQLLFQVFYLEEELDNSHMEL
jgi:hypothetical protein